MKRMFKIMLAGLLGLIGMFQGRCQITGPFSSAGLTLGQWEQRKAELIHCFKQTLNFESLPKVATNKLFTAASKRKYKKYTVQNFAIQTLPGVYVCGSIYAPRHIKGKLPLVLSPNGHFPGGRYRADQQSLCGTLASMGMIAVSYDMMGWGESRLQFNESDHYTPSAMIVQLLNCARLLDYFCSRKDVDTSKIVITGASGGGSQAILNTALDNRIKYSIPVVMLSAEFPGGCPCENGIPARECNGGTNNAEIAAIAAPRKQLIISCGADWTKTVPTKEFPYLKKMYEKYNAADAVQNVHLPSEGHDYGLSKRIAVYQHLYSWLHNNSNANAQITSDDPGVVIEPEENLFFFGNDRNKLPANAIRSINQLNILP